MYNLKKKTNFSFIRSLFGLCFALFILSLSHPAHCAVGDQAWRYAPLGAVTGDQVIGDAIAFTTNGNYLYYVSKTGGLAWKKSVTTDANAAPIITEYTSQIIYGSNTTVSAYDYSGNIVWTTNLPVAITTPPAQDSKLNLVFGTATGCIIISSTGAIVANVNLGKAATRPPVVGESSYFITCADAIIAVRQADLTNAWTYATGGTVSPLAIGKGEQILFGNSAGQLVSLAASTGGVNWQINTPGVVSFSPVVDISGNVYAVTNNSIIFGVTATGSGLFAQSVSGTILGAPCLDFNNNIYIANNQQQILKYTSAGVLNHTFALSANATGGVKILNNLILFPQGNFLTALENDQALPLGLWPMYRQYATGQANFIDLKWNVSNNNPALGFSDVASDGSNIYAVSFGNQGGCDNLLSKIVDGQLTYNEFGYGASSLMLTNNMLVVKGNGYGCPTVARDKSLSQTYFSFSTDKGTQHPEVFTTDGNILYVITYYSNAYTLRAYKNNVELWSTNLGLYTYTEIAIDSDGSLILLGYDLSTRLYALEKYAPTDGSFLATTNVTSISSQGASKLAVSDNRIYVRSYEYTNNLNLPKIICYSNNFEKQYNFTIASPSSSFIAYDLVNYYVKDNVIYIVTFGGNGSNHSAIYFSIYENGTQKSILNIAEATTASSYFSYYSNKGLLGTNAFYTTFRGYIIEIDLASNSLKSLKTVPGYGIGYLSGFTNDVFLSYSGSQMLAIGQPGYTSSNNGWTSLQKDTLNSRSASLVDPRVNTSLAPLLFLLQGN